jgi:hypothetical protein
LNMDTARGNDRAGARTPTHRARHCKLQAEPVFVRVNAPTLVVNKLLIAVNTLQIEVHTL